MSKSIKMKETKDIILHTAYSMFLNNNYEAVTINSIIKAAGITKGGIYHYYASKEELFKAVVDNFLIENRTSIHIEYSSLREFIDNNIKKAKEQVKLKSSNNEIDLSAPAQHISLFMAAFKYYPNFSEIGRKFYNEELSIWVDAIELSKKNGEVSNKVNSEIMAMNFMAIGTSIVTNTMLGGSIDYALEMHSKQLLELYHSIKV